MPVLYGDILIDIWDVSDVMRYAKENSMTISSDEALQVLKYIEYNYDGDNGITWRIIEDAIDCVIDERKEK